MVTFAEGGIPNVPTFCANFHFQDICLAGNMLEIIYDAFKNKNKVLGLFHLKLSDASEPRFEIIWLSHKTIGCI